MTPRPSRRHADQRADPARLRDRPHRCRRSRSSPSCTAPSSRAARSCSPPASSARRGSTPASAPTSCAETKHDPRRRLEDRADAAGAAVPPRRDHRPGRRQDGHQRLQLGRRLVHDRLRGHATRRSWTNQIQGQINLGQAIRRTLTLEQRTPAGTKTYKLNDKIATLQVRPRGWHLDEKHVTVDGQRVARRHLRLRAVHVPQREGAARARRRPVLLPAEDGEPSRGAALERHLRDDAGRARPAAGHDQGDGADRDHPRRLRDGRDPLRAARAPRRPQRRALGLHLQLHQEVQARPRLLPGRPRQGDDDGAVHARLRAAAAARPATSAARRRSAA